MQTANYMLKKANNRKRKVLTTPSVMIVLVHNTLRVSFIRVWPLMNE